MEDQDDLSFFAPALPEDLIDSLPKLTERQQLWVDCFEGDLVKAARLAGYTGNSDALRQRSLDLLKNPKVKTHLQNRAKYEERKKNLILSRDERMIFLSAVVRNADPYGKVDEFGKDASEREISLQQRLKAVELLSKAHGDFSETLNVNHNISVSDLVLKSFHDDTPIEAIEAEYKRVREAQQAIPESELGDLI